MTTDAQQSLRAWNRGLLAAMLCVGVIALLTGIVLFPEYRADVAGAHQTVTQIASGPMKFVRNAHHWASALLIVFGVAYILVGLVRSAYRKPGHWVWIGGIALFLLGMLLQLTGHLLPWDQHDVRTAVIETGIAQSAPGIGAIQGKLLRGGEAVGPGTLRLWYLAHIGLLTVPFVLLIVGLPLLAKRHRVDFKKRAWIGGALAAVVILALAVPAPLGKAATPADYDSFAARPEWYIIPLHGSLDLFQKIKPELGFVGSMVLPGIALLLVLALPWLDRRGRPGLGRAFGIVGIVSLIGLTAIGIGNVAPLTGDQIVASETPKPTQDVKLDPKLVAQGRDLYKPNGCDDCHRINGMGGKIGPDLSDEGNRQPDVDWQMRHLAKPSAVTPGSTMPAYSNLKQTELRALAQYLVSLKKGSATRG